MEVTAEQLEAAEEAVRALSALHELLPDDDELVAQVGAAASRVDRIHAELVSKAAQQIVDSWSSGQEQSK